MRLKQVVVETLAAHEDKHKNVWADAGSWRSLEPARIAGRQNACNFLLERICDATAF